jgi:endonuclease/exonuclease/phosphatase family metal-dependent hydrolase
VVGVQEAVLWRTQSPPPSSVIEIPGSATSVRYDFVKLLVKSLRRLGVHYRAVAITDNVDVQVNARFPSGRQLAIRYTDRVAILARRDVKVSNVRDANFHAHDDFNLLGAKIAVLDGYASVNARVGGRTIRFITTHLDGLNDANSTSIRAAEAKEILDGPAATKLPVVLTCDCNSRPNSATHAELTEGGLRDKWHALNPRSPGLTCCHRSSPSDLETDVADPHPRQGLVERLDYIWTTHQFTVVREHTVGLNRADRTKTRPRLWPSDHLGLVAHLELR